MKKMFKITAYVLMIFSLMIINTEYINTAEAANSDTTTASPISISPLQVVNNPEKYLNKSITFTAEFAGFSSLGLDYQPALRTKEKYISILIARPDVLDHTIPLSEMKMFMTRELAEKNIDAEPGDKVKITGKVFSTALGDPWVDITSFTILSSNNKK